LSAALRAERLARCQPERGRVIQVLGGHSGAEVLLCEHDGHSFVRKTALNPTANLRLRRQAIKQRLLAARDLPFPCVQTIGLDQSGRAYFEMDYVPARTLCELVVNAVPFDRAAVMAAIARLTRVSSSACAGTLSAHLFRDKIEAIVAQSRTHPAMNGHSDAIAALATQLTACNWKGIPQSAGHGDLTLENILVSPERGVVFIDCDEAWVSSWWLDLAKLFQDLEGRWCLRALSQPSVDALERLAQLAADFRGLAGEIDSSLPPRITQFAALHLFRTLPYVQSAGDAGFVCAAVARLVGDTHD